MYISTKHKEKCKREIEKTTKIEKKNGMKLVIIVVVFDHSPTICLRIGHVQNPKKKKLLNLYSSQSCGILWVLQSPQFGLLLHHQN